MLFRLCRSWRTWLARACPRTSRWKRKKRTKMKTWRRFHDITCVQTVWLVYFLFFHYLSYSIVNLTQRRSSLLIRAFSFITSILAYMSIWLSCNFNFYLPSSKAWALRRVIQVRGVGINFHKCELTWLCNCKERKIAFRTHFCFLTTSSIYTIGLSHLTTLWSCFKSGRFLTSAS